MNIGVACVVHSACVCVCVFMICCEIFKNFESQSQCMYVLYCICMWVYVCVCVCVVCGNYLEILLYLIHEGIVMSCAKSHYIH